MFSCASRFWLALGGQGIWPCVPPPFPISGPTAPQITHPPNQPPHPPKPTAFLHLRAGALARRFHPGLGFCLRRHPRVGGRRRRGRVVAGCGCGYGCVFVFFLGGGEVVVGMCSLWCGLGWCLTHPWGLTAWVLPTITHTQQGTRATASSRATTSPAQPTCKANGTPSRRVLV